MSPARVFFVALLAMTVAAALQRRAPAEPDGAQLHQPKNVEDAIGRLGSADPAERDAASEFLWSLGEPTRSALNAAADDDNVETARRATELLDRLRYGIRPDTPGVIVDLLSQYRAAPLEGNARAVATSVAGLASSGSPGLRVLTRLWQEEADDARRRLIGQALAEKSRPAAAILLADGETAGAINLLEAAADARSPWGEPAIRDLAATLMLHDGGARLDERIAKLKPIVAQGAGDKEARVRAGRLLAYLCRARGDLPAALWAAERATELPGESPLAELLRAESANWKELASRAAAKPNTDDSVEDLGFAAAYHRLAGDAAGLERYARKLAALADRRPDEAMLAAEALFLNDRPDAGVGVLLKHKAFAEAAELLTPRMQFDELLSLARRLAEANEPDAAAVSARAAVAQHVLGDHAGAVASIEKLVADTAGKNAAPHSVAHYALLAESATAIGRADLAEQCAARGIAVARPTDDIAELLQAAGFTPGGRAARWWRVMKEKYKEPTRVTFGRLRSLLSGQMAAGELEALARAAADSARRIESADLKAALADIGDTLTAVGHKPVAARYFRWLSEWPPAAPIALIRLGDFEGEADRWDAAAMLYARAWELDRSQPLPLLLRGSALKHIGREKEGGNLIDLAHRLPLADEAARHALMTELEQRKMRDDARRERDLIIRTAGFQSWYQSDALRRAGDEAYENEQFAAAAELWDRAFLDNNSRSTRFARLWANFAMPALIHRARAQGLIRSGDFATAHREADLAMLYSPSDTDSVITIVEQLDGAGQKAEADALYRRHTAPFRAFCAAHPNSAQAHNQFAWAAAKCRRELDDALKHAARAVELDPKSTACLDTLAETYFQRGDVQKAIETMNRCVELEPNEKRHQEQLERFSAIAPSR